MSEKPTRPRRPERGAVPAPKSEIGDAPPYVPDDDEPHQDDTQPAATEPHHDER